MTDRLPVSVSGDRRIGEFSLREHLESSRRRSGVYGLDRSYRDHALRSAPLRGVIQGGATSVRLRRPPPGADGLANTAQVRRAVSGIGRILDEAHAVIGLPAR